MSYDCDVQVCLWRGSRPPRWWGRRELLDSYPWYSWRGISHLIYKPYCCMFLDMFLSLIGLGWIWKVFMKVWNIISNRVCVSSIQPERSVWGQRGLWAHDGHKRHHRRLHCLLWTNPLLEATADCAPELPFFLHCHLWAWLFLCLKVWQTDQTGRNQTPAGGFTFFPNCTFKNISVILSFFSACRVETE